MKQDSYRNYFTIWLFCNLFFLRFLFQISRRCPLLDRSVSRTTELIELNKLNGCVVKPFVECACDVDTVRVFLEVVSEPPKRNVCSLSQRRKLVGSSFFFGTLSQLFSAQHRRAIIISIDRSMSFCARLMRVANKTKGTKLYLNHQQPVMRLYY